jgi:hypothetical protein
LRSARARCEPLLVPVVLPDVSLEPDMLLPLDPLVPEFMELLVPEFVELLVPRLASLPAPSVPVPLPAVEPVELDPVVFEDIPAPVRLPDWLAPEVVELPEPELFMPVLLLVPEPAPPALVPPVPCARATPPTARAAAATRVERVVLVAFICFLPGSVYWVAAARAARKAS